MTLALYGKSRRRQVSLVILALFAVLGALAVSASMLIGASAASVEPTPIRHLKNASCAELQSKYAGGQTWLEFKIDQKPQKDLYTKGDLWVRITNVYSVGSWPNKTLMFDWESNFGVDAVFVKQASDAHNLYVYAGTAESTESFGDTGLGPQHGHNDISHVTFCYDPGDPTTPTPTEDPKGTIIVEKIGQDGVQDTTTDFTGKIKKNSTTIENWSLKLGESVSYTVSPGSYKISENSVSGWSLVGFDKRDADQACRTDKSKYGDDDDSFTVGDGKTVKICVMNKAQTGKLTIEKVAPKNTNGGSNTKFVGTIDDATPWEVGGIGNRTTHTVSVGSHTVNETNVPDGWQLVGYKAPNYKGECSTDKSGYELDKNTVTVSKGGETKLCVMNEKAPQPKYGWLKVHKVAAPGSIADTETEFGINVDGATKDSIKIGGHTGEIKLTTGSHVVTETTSNGWTLVGYAPKGWYGECSTDPSKYTHVNLGSTVTIKHDETTKLCVMNDKQPETVTGRVIVAKVVTNDSTDTTSFTVNLDGSSSAPVTQQTPAEFPELDEGTYTVTEAPQAGYQLLGYAPGTRTDNGTVCPATPEQQGGNQATIAKGNEIPVVCVYNLKLGALEVTKTVEGGPDATQKFEVCLSGGPSNMQADCKNIGNGETATWPNLVPGTYTLAEKFEGNEASFWTVTGPGDVTVNPGQPTTHTIKNTRIGQTITFLKYVCDTYGDVPGNPGTDGSDDRGKPSHSGFDMTLGPIDANRPATPDQFPNCNTAEGWTFSLFGSEADAQANQHSVGSASAGQTLALTPAQLDLALAGNLWVKENYKEASAGYGFGVLKCYTDQLNNDNLEFVSLDKPGTEGVYCIAANVKPRFRDLEVCKVVEQNNDGELQNGDFNFEVSWAGQADGPLAFSISAEEGGEPVCETIKVPPGKSVEILEKEARTGGLQGAWREGDAPGYPQHQTDVNPARVSNKKAKNVGTDVNKVTFFNKANPLTGNIVVKKVVTNVENDETIFVVTLDGETIDPKDDSIREYEELNAQFNDLLPGAYTVTEAPQDGYVTLGWALANEDGSCPAWPTEQENLQLATAQASDNVAYPGVEAGETTTICFYNEAVGTIIITKNNQTAIESWDFEVSGRGNANITGFGENSVTIDNVPLGTYTVNEVLDEIGDNATIVEECTLNTPNEILAKVIEGPTLSLTNPGGEIHFIFSNQTCDIVLGSGNLVIQKVEDLNGNGVRDAGEKLIAWTATVEGIEFPGGENFDLVGGARFIPGLTPGSYTVTEGSKAGYKTIGVRVDGGTLAAGDSVVANVTNGHDTVVTFYNQPLFDIEVRKTELSSAGSFAGQGWTFTLEGCGIAPATATTGPDGRATFAGLEIPDGRCAYTVTETQQAGWTAAGSLERRVSSAKPGVTTVLFYTNIRVEEPTPTVTPTETPTEPTETVTTTPTDTPDVTSTVEPQEPSSPSPSPTETPIDDVEGDRTPGAPSTGSGLFGDSAGSFNLLLALAGLASLSVGFGLFALRTRRND